MRRFTFAKLVRDNIVEQIVAAGNIPHWRVLSNKEYLHELKKKIVEEAQEIPNTSTGDLVKELADIQELIDILLMKLDVTKEEFRRIQKNKKEKAGSFRKKHYIEYADINEDSEWTQYYLRNSKKYPEIT